MPRTGLGFLAGQAPFGLVPPRTLGQRRRLHFRHRRPRKVAPSNRSGSLGFPPPGAGPSPTPTAIGPPSATLGSGVSWRRSGVWRVAVASRAAWGAPCAC